MKKEISEIERLQKENCGLKTSLNKYKLQNNLLRDFIFNNVYCVMESLKTKNHYYESFKRRSFSEKEKYFYDTIIKNNNSTMEKLKELYNFSTIIFKH